MPHEGAPYAVFVYAALLPWTFFSTSITTASTSLVSHNNLITKVYFPARFCRSLTCWRRYLTFVMASVVLALLLAVYHVPITAGIVLAVPVMAIAFIFSLAIALFLSAFQVRFRDIGIAMALIMQLWMYRDAGRVPLSVVPRRFSWLYSLNPMAGVVENFRQIVLEHAGTQSARSVSGPAGLAGAAAGWRISISRPRKRPWRM